ncbi:hypothetical protein H1R20_g3392, partial [Candolleomyces eurysporus]
MLLRALPVLSLPCLALAAIFNRTIDDAAGDPVTGRKPTFSPRMAAGYQVWQNQACTDCAIRPDLGHAFGNSYTETTYNPRMERISISIPFEGTAIYIFFILANGVSNPDVTTLTECKFALDSEPPVRYQHTPNPATSELSYNQLVYNRTNLPQREHVLNIIAEGYAYPVYINFDYAIYSYDDGSPQPPITTPVPPAGPSGGAVGGSNGTTMASTFTTIVRTTGPDGRSITVTQYMLAETTATSTTQLETDGFNTDNSSRTSRLSIGAIVGGVIAAVALLIVLVLLPICLLRRKRSLQSRKQLTREADHPRLRPGPLNVSERENSSPSSSILSSPSPCKPFYLGRPHEQKRRS